MNEYDVVIVGIGTAGETAAGILRDGGKKVAVIDQGPVGGTCALRGCQPKKVFVVNTHLAAESRALLGTGLSQPAVTDWGALQRFKRTFTDPIPGSTQASLEASGIDVFVEPAAFVEPGVIELAGSGRKLHAERFLIASGARSRALPVPGAELAATSDDFLELSELPESMVFIGGGYISMEFAFIAALSGSKVTILQRGPRVLPVFPASLVDPVVEAGAEHGIRFVTNADVSGIERDGSAYRVATKEQGEFSAAWVMGAIGRSPNVEDLGLEKVGVKASGRGIEVNEYLETLGAGGLRRRRLRRHEAALPARRSGSEDRRGEHHERAFGCGRLQPRPLGGVHAPADGERRPHGGRGPRRRPRGDGEVGSWRCVGELPPNRWPGRLLRDRRGREDRCAPWSSRSEPLRGRTD